MDYSGSIKTHPDLKKAIKDHKEALKRDAHVLLDLSEGAEKVLAAREAVEANKQKKAVLAREKEALNTEMNELQIKVNSLAGKAKDAEQDFKVLKTNAFRKKKAMQL